MQDPFPEDCAKSFRAQRLLGQGGNGRVYLAEQLRLKRDVAVKLLDATLTADSEAARRFAREARVTAGLDHPHVVGVLDSGAATGAPWIAYEYVAGGTLRDRIASGPLPLAEAVEVVHQLALALGAAHAQGVLHRDVKPDNVLVGPDHVHKLTDFGLAWCAGSQTITTRAGVVMGTPAYIAPEVVRGEPPVPEGDLYALAVMLHELVVGRPPFEAGSIADLLRMHLEATPPPLSAMLSGVPDAMERFVTRGMAKQPADRWQGADAFIEALEAAAQGSGVRLRPRVPPPARAVGSSVGETIAVHAPARIGATVVADAPHTGRPRAWLVAGTLIGLGVVAQLTPARAPVRNPASPTPQLPAAAPADWGPILAEARKTRSQLDRLAPIIRSKQLDLLAQAEGRQNLSDEFSHLGVLLASICWGMEHAARGGLEGPNWMGLEGNYDIALQLLNDANKADLQRRRPDLAKLTLRAKAMLVVLGAAPTSNSWCQLARASASMALTTAFVDSTPTLKQTEAREARATQLRLLEAMATLLRVLEAPLSLDSWPVFHIHELGQLWFRISRISERLRAGAREPRLIALSREGSRRRCEIALALLARWDEAGAQMFPADRMLDALEAAHHLLATHAPGPDRELALRAIRDIAGAVQARFPTFRVEDRKQDFARLVKLAADEGFTPAIGVDLEPLTR